MTENEKQLERLQDKRSALFCQKDELMIQIKKNENDIKLQSSIVLEDLMKENKDVLKRLKEWE